MSHDGPWCGVCATRFGIHSFTSKGDLTASGVTNPGSGALADHHVSAWDLHNVDKHATGCNNTSMEYDSHLWVHAVRLAGVLHFLTLGLACVTPIPPNWEQNLSRLPEVHRRFAVTQNISIGAVIAACGLVSLLFAPLLVEGSTLARVICGGIALWWGGRLVVSRWLGVHRHLATPLLRIGYALLLAECALYLLGYGYLALR